MSSGNRRIVVVCRRTQLEELVIRHNTAEQARFSVERLGEDFADYVDEDERYRRALCDAQEALRDLGRLHLVQREYLPNLIFAEDDIVIAIGQDGLVANTLKYLQGQPLIGVNPDPRRWDGVLLPFTVGDLAAIVRDVIAGRRPQREVSMALAQTSDGQSLLAVNDLFVGRRSHASARYRIFLSGAAQKRQSAGAAQERQSADAMQERQSAGATQERQSSSGVIVSTGLGSTGWLRSIYTGALAVANVMQGRSLEQPAFAPPPPMPWDARYLTFTVREPFPSQNSQVNMAFGWVTEPNELRIISEMPEDGLIFSDGIEEDYLEFCSGVEARIGLAPTCGYLVQ